MSGSDRVIESFSSLLDTYAESQQDRDLFISIFESIGLPWERLVKLLTGPEHADIVSFGFDKEDFGSKHAEAISSLFTGPHDAFPRDVLVASLENPQLTDLALNYFAMCIKDFMEVKDEV